MCEICFLYLGAYLISSRNKICILYTNNEAHLLLICIQDANFIFATKMVHHNLFCAHFWLYVILSCTSRIFQRHWRGLLRVNCSNVVYIHSLTSSTEDLSSVIILVPRAESGSMSHFVAWNTGGLSSAADSKMEVICQGLIELTRDIHQFTMKCTSMHCETQSGVNRSI